MSFSSFHRSKELAFNKFYSITLKMFGNINRQGIQTDKEMLSEQFYNHANMLAIKTVRVKNNLFIMPLSRFQFFSTKGIHFCNFFCYLTLSAKNTGIQII
jgi:hypothetical protein